MIILAVDTTATACSVALRRDGKLFGEFTIDSGNTHSETLLPMVEALLSACKITFDKIDAYAVSVGPGSFTGVRIGTAAMKGLALPRAVPCIPVSTLSALAENLKDIKGIICPAMDARRNQVYTGLFRSNGKVITRISEDMAISIEELSEKISAFDENVFLCGDGYRLVSHISENITCERLCKQSGASVAAVAERIWNETEDKSIFAPSNLIPVYLRKPQAEREREERLALENNN